MQIIFFGKRSQKQEKEEKSLYGIIYDFLVLRRGFAVENSWYITPLIGFCLHFLSHSGWDPIEFIDGTKMIDRYWAKLYSMSNVPRHCSYLNLDFFPQLYFTKCFHWILKTFQNMFGVWGWGFRMSLWCSDLWQLQSVLQKSSGR